MKKPEDRIIKEINERPGAVGELDEETHRCGEGECVHSIVASMKYHKKAIKACKGFLNPESMEGLNLAGAVDIMLIFAIPPTNATSAYVGAVMALHEADLS